MEFTLIKTNKYPLGAYLTSTGIRVSAQMTPGKTSGIILFLENENKPLKIEFPKWAWTGRICSVQLELQDQSDINPFVCKDNRGVRYLLYNGEDVFADPYMTDSDGTKEFGKTAKLYSRVGITNKNSDHNYVDIPMANAVYYMLHVRGYTAHKSSKVKYPGTFGGLSSKLSYIKDLGVTSLVLMPVYEFNEIIKNNDSISAQPDKPDMVNYWGYTQGYYYTPKASYAHSDNPNIEFANLVNDIHKKSMEVILQFYFPGNYSSREITDILRFWHDRYDIDGFQLIGAGIPVNDICLDPELYDCKFIFDDAITRTDEEYNRKHIHIEQSGMVVLRKFLKGDPNSAYEAALQLKMYDPATNPLNYLARQDTMRLIDIVSYNEKHNENNGENGRDGADYNFSWNCGYEGPTRKKNILMLRSKQIRNALALALLGQRAPLIYSGDEFGNTQFGNNNPYNQDNETGYIKWPTTSAGKDLIAFTKRLLEIRLNHPILNCGCTLTGRDYLSLGYPDISLHGEELWRADLGPTSHCFGILYYDKYADSDDDRLLYIIFNMHWEEQQVAIPKLKGDNKWNVLLSSDDNNTYENEKAVCVAPRSFVVLEGIG